MLDALRGIMGEYVPITYGSDAIIPSGLAGVNMEYVAGCVLFAIGVYSVFRLIGIIVRGA